MLKQTQPIKFADLPDGSYFCPQNEWDTPSRRIYQKTMEDGGEHNAVYSSFNSVGFTLNPNEPVILIQG